MCGGDKEEFTFVQTRYIASRPCVQTQYIASLQWVQRLCDRSLLTTLPIPDNNITQMSQFYSELSQELIGFIEEQKIFFTATAPDSGRINLSPKGIDTFRCLDQKNCRVSGFNRKWK